VKTSIKQSASYLKKVPGDISDYLMNVFHKNPVEELNLNSNKRKITFWIENKTYNPEDFLRIAELR